MSKIIIENKSKTPDDVVLSLVQDVMRDGRVSDKGRCYCYVSKYASATVYASLNKCSDKFLITDD